MFQRKSLFLSWGIPLQHTTKYGYKCTGVALLLRRPLGTISKIVWPKSGLQGSICGLRMVLPFWDVTFYAPVSPAAEVAKKVAGGVAAELKRLLRLLLARTIPNANGKLDGNDEALTGVDNAGGTFSDEMLHFLLLAFLVVG